MSLLYGFCRFVLSDFPEMSAECASFTALHLVCLRVMYAKKIPTQCPGCDHFEKCILENLWPRTPVTSAGRSTISNSIMNISALNLDINLIVSAQKEKSLK